MLELQIDVMNSDFTDKVRVVDRLVFTPNSYWKIDSFRRATGEKISEGKKVSFESEDCIDRKGRLQLRTAIYNGKPRNEVDYYIEPDETQQTAGKPTPAASAAAMPVTQTAAKGTVPSSTENF